jgi:O-antigen/teichoic acid export membrane protein
VVLRLGLALALLGWHHLPVARATWPRWAELRRVGRYAVGYATSRALGLVVYRGAITLAPAVVSLEAVTALVLGDQLGANLYRVSHVVYETLFPRLARLLRPGASAAERDGGRSLYVATSLVVTGLLVAGAVGLSVLGPWLVPAWLGSEPPGTSALLPWVALSWAINGNGGPSTCALMAGTRNRLSVWAHLVAVLLNLVLIFTLGPRGLLGLGAALLVTNAVLVALLSLSACRTVGHAWWRFLAWHGALYALGALAYSVAGHAPGPRLPVAVAAGTATLGMAAIVWWLNPDLQLARRLLAELTAAPAEAGR